MPPKTGAADYLVAASLILALLGLLTLDAAALLYLLGWPSGWWFFIGLVAVVVGCSTTALVSRLFLHDSDKDA